MTDTVLDDLFHTIFVAINNQTGFNIHIPEYNSIWIPTVFSLLPSNLYEEWQNKHFLKYSK